MAAADDLFARSESPGSVSMDDVAAAAGVGKGTLFRRFGDRTGLIRVLVEARLERLRQAVDEGPAPLGPTAEPRERVLALLDAVLQFKLDNRRLSLALEEAGSGSPYQADHYTWWHSTLEHTLRQLPGFSDSAVAGRGSAIADSGFAAHVLLAATRADLVEHLAGEEQMSRERMRAHLAAFAARVLHQ
nr:TetR/AcrR family transcriptional regulator [Streptomyces scabichelini]